MNRIYRTLFALPALTLGLTACPDDGDDDGGDEGGASATAGATAGATADATAGDTSDGQTTSAGATAGETATGTAGATSDATAADSGSDTGGDTAGTTAGEDVCRPCVLAECPTQATACLGDPVCACWSECVPAGNDDAACTEMCGDEPQAWTDVTTCIQENCAAECIGDSGTGTTA